MAFAPKALVRKGAVQIPVGTVAGLTNQRLVSQFGYATDDAAATVEGAGYFNAAAGELLRGSTIVVIAAFAGTPIRKEYVVTANTGTVVTIALQTTTAG